jgi:hypothetical protein
MAKDIETQLELDDDVVDLGDAVQLTEGGPFKGGEGAANQSEQL